MDLSTKEAFLLFLFQIPGIFLQDFGDVSVLDPAAVRYGDTAKIACDFSGSEVNLEHITWTKITSDGRRMPVHWYDSCSGENTGYNDLYGRSLLEVHKPTDSNGVATKVTGSRDNEDASAREAFVSSFKPENNAIIYSYLSDKNRPRRLGYGRAVLSIHQVELIDNGMYECTVKLRQRAPVSALTKLQVIVPPSTPYIYTNHTEILNGDNVTITCSGNTGLPGGAILWSIRKPNERSFVELPESSSVSMTTTLRNGTRWTISSVELHLTDVDDQSVIRCQTDNRVLRFWEKKPTATMLLTVLFPPKDGKILFDASLGKYYCDARARPLASYVWLRLGEVKEDDDVNKNDKADDKRIIMSTNRFLDLSSIVGEGYFRFRCLASNVIDDMRHTKVMDTKLRVIGRRPRSPITSPVPLQPAINHPEDRDRWLSAQGPPFNMLNHNANIQPLGAERSGFVAVNKHNANNDVAEKAGDTTTNVATATLSGSNPVITESAKQGPDISKVAKSVTIQPQLRIGRAGGGGGGRRGGGGGGGGGGDYEVFEDRFFIQTPLQMSRLLSSIMARRGPDSHQAEPLLSLTLKNGTRIPADISAPEYKRIRNVFYKRLLDLAKSRKLAYLRRNKSINNNDTNNNNDKKGSARNTQMNASQNVNTPEVRGRIQQALPSGALMKMMPDGYNDVMEVGDKLKEYGNVLEAKTIMDRNNQSTEEKLAEHDPDIEGFVDYTPPRYRVSMNRFAKSLKVLEKEPLETAALPAAMESTGQPTDELSNTAEVVTRTTWREFDCRDKADGSYGGGCRAFYRCLSGETYFVQCKHQNVYNKDSQRCTHPDKAPGPCGIWRDCGKLKNGKYPDIGRACKYYYTCQGGVFFGHNKCNKGLLFNDKLQICDWPYNITPPCGQKTNDIKDAPAN